MQIAILKLSTGLRPKCALQLCASLHLARSKCRKLTLPLIEIQWRQRSRKAMGAREMPGSSHRSEMAVDAEIAVASAMRRREAQPVK